MKTVRARCNADYLVGDWEVINIGENLAAMCGTLTYKVTKMQDKQLDMRETCTKTSTTASMVGYQTGRTGSYEFQKTVKEGRLGHSSGITLVWKRGKEVVAVAYYHHLLHATTKEYARPLWFKKGMLTEQEQEKILKSHLRMQKM